MLIMEYDAIVIYLFAYAQKKTLFLKGNEWKMAAVWVSIWKLLTPLYYLLLSDACLTPLFKKKPFILHEKKFKSDIPNFP